MVSTIRLTVGQAIVRFLEAQQVTRDGQTNTFFGGALGIMGHGNVGGVGQAFLEEKERMRFIQGRNEQGMGHIAVGYARLKNRMGAMVVTTSIGPGAANLVTAAGTATVNHLPVLLLPSDIFSTRRAGSVLQQIEDERSYDVSGNDSLRPVSRYWDRINRPEQLPTALLAAMETLTNPAKTGAVTLCLPQDVQAEAYDFPTSLFKERIWRIGRPRADADALAAAAEAIRASKRPFIIAGGGTVYSSASQDLTNFIEHTGIPVGSTQAAKGAVAYEHPLNVGPLGSIGLKYANQLARQADLIIGIGTRYTDFTSASNTMFQDPSVRFVNINVASFDANKEAAIAVVGDAREAIRELGRALKDWQVPSDYRRQAEEAADEARAEVVRQTQHIPGDNKLGQKEVIGIVNSFAKPQDVVVNAAGSMPSDLQKLWRPGSPLGYSVEYGYSCMGYEIPAGLGMRMAAPDREIFTFIGDASFLMYHQDVLTAIQEHEKIIIILVDNHGFGSINTLSHQVGSQGFETRFYMKNEQGLEDKDHYLPIDFPKILEGYGVPTYCPTDAEELKDAVKKAVDGETIAAIYVTVDPVVRDDSSQAWWDVATPQVAHIDSSKQAHQAYEEVRTKEQKLYL
ncbi:3D-(3,5/4)-trihydroxycyclohexane-1,2-dione acylhydrolase (decyclizing) [Bifidobacterium polysaccharolyticum]|uniref:3D-(3,5/4)-trihydroxycyclohexane-1,2-dione acylhydrolase (decyclizing) n=1 Tax=Bifidobacterium polysaccharolyticum TaxID=2750967 RepID=UPI0018DD2DB2|nr:3D-(3,5/4)-trihydroxycyclohexane-1,2-dione acylhydrolase (decyclizing) [Bifidobacterium polysaccharolyticum]MBI0064751.1 3D-(3,5/4)-trihydroxycyclohexane-1,2-dione acylhydrolase (decyclizing) [Bifidobacterium polysaccharolyticum]